jgi:hypothetical protein
MKNKIFWLIMLILILTVSCGEKNNTSGTDGSKEIVLRFLWWGSESRHKATLDAIKLFEEKNPGIKIKAKQMSIIPEVKPLINKLLLTNFRISNHIIVELLKLNNE